MFWINDTQLDDEQKAAVRGIDLNASFLLRGPAGSGKTNVLLLRARQLQVKGLSDFKIVVFTRSLREFVQSGAKQYGVSPDAVVTANELFRGILAEYGMSFEPTGSFEEDRSMLAGRLNSLLTSKEISDIIPALLIDEGQDYTDTELLVFRRLTPRLMIACDSRQSIYRQTGTQEVLTTVVGDNTVTLKYHYRTGLKLCTVADGILTDTRNFPPIRGECKYDEKTRPSSFEVSPCASFAQQIDLILSRLPAQVDLYGTALIGVMFPKREQQVLFTAALEASSLVPDKSTIRVNTLHGAKGWEYQAAHIGGCEALSRMGAVQKRLIYTGILRARTSVHLYHTGHMPGYLETAVSSIMPPAPDPGWDQIFGA